MGKRLFDCLTFGHGDGPDQKMLDKNMLNAILVTLLMRVTRAFPYFLAAAWLIHRNNAIDPIRSSMMVSLMCVIAAGLFCLAGLALFISGESAEQLY